jgi:hypothetical protein
MDTKEILRWTVKIIIVITLVILINILSDKFGKDRVILNALAIALLLYCIGKLLLKK